MEGHIGVNKTSKKKITQKGYKDFLLDYEVEGKIPKTDEIIKLLNKHGYQSHTSTIADLNSKLVDKGFLVRGQYSRLYIAATMIKA